MSMQDLSLVFGESVAAAVNLTPEMMSHLVLQREKKYGSYCPTVDRERLRGLAFSAFWFGIKAFKLGIASRPEPIENLPRIGAEQLLLSERETLTAQYALGVSLEDMPTFEKRVLHIMETGIAVAQQWIDTERILGRRRKKETIVGGHSKRRKPRVDLSEWINSKRLTPTPTADDLPELFGEGS